jgi:hypothetical protein
MGITFTEEGKQSMRKSVLEAHFDPARKEEMDKVAKCLDLSLKEVEDRFIEGVLHKPTEKVVCEADGSKCTICGGFFPDGDNICTSGHQLGEQYCQ